MLHREGPARTVHTAAAADPGPRDDHDHRVNARVMTCDGHPGTVTAVHDGPFPGTEAYMVRLDADLGGGYYTSGQLQPAPTSLTGTAAADYPELAQTIAEHPDPGRHTASMTMNCPGCGDRMTSSRPCAMCGQHHHNDPWCCGHACEDCGKTVMDSGGHRTYCGTCGQGDHHTGCCTSPEALEGISDLFSGPEWDAHHQYMDGNPGVPSRMSGRR